jgi:hypothetical protein
MPSKRKASLKKRVPRKTTKSPRKFKKSHRKSKRGQRGKAAKVKANKPSRRDLWNQESSWVRRFIQASFELNGKMCGIPITPDTVWTDENIVLFNAHMESVKTLASRMMVLYRGSTSDSPTMQDFSQEITTCQFMSTSKSKKIAAEFIFKGKGFLHTLHLHPGVAFYDFQEHYGADPIKREKEVVVYPQQRLVFRSKKGNNVIWDVFPRE